MRPIKREAAPSPSASAAEEPNPKRTKIEDKPDIKEPQTEREKIEEKHAVKMPETSCKTIFEKQLAKNPQLKLPIIKDLLPNIDYTKPGPNGGLPVGTTMTEFYLDSERLATILRVHHHQLLAFLGTDPAMAQQWTFYQHFIRTLPPGMSGKEILEENILVMPLLHRGLGPDWARHHPALAINAVTHDNWGANAWAMSILQAVHDACVRVGLVLPADTTSENHWIWAYMLLKCKEHLESMVYKGFKCKEERKSRYLGFESVGQKYAKAKNFMVLR